MTPIKTAAIMPQTPIPASAVVPKTGPMEIPGKAPFFPERERPIPDKRQPVNQGTVSSYGGPMPLDYGSPAAAGQSIEPEKSSLTMPLILGGIAVAALLIFRSKK